MQMNPNLILQAGQTADILGSMQRGNALAGQVNDQRRQNALAGFYRDNGAALMQGDQNALAGLAQYDPQAAFGMQRQIKEDAWRADDRQYGRSRDAVADARFARQDERADREWQWKVEEYAAQKSLAERQAEAQQIEQAVKMGLGLSDPQSWDAQMSQIAPDLVGQFDNRQAIANRYMSIADILKGQGGPDWRVASADEAAKYGAQAGQINARTGEFKRTPLDSGMAIEVDPNTGQISVRQGAGVGGKGSHDPDAEFFKAMSKDDAAVIKDINTSGLAAERNMARIDQLESLLSNSPTGFSAIAAQKAGEWGINTEGLDTLQAAQAMINSLVPEQRQPGSGPMSDADLELFKQSLPRIINQPGGNQKIIAMMRGIAQYDAEGSKIVQDLRSDKISRAEAFAQLRARQNPLTSGRVQSEQPAPQAPATQQGIPNGVDPSDWEFMTPEERALFQ